jgi:ArsR family transcriptional regulator
MEHNHGQYAAAFKALADETRLKIIAMLSCGELCACEILAAFSISQSTLSYHMKILADNGLVNAVRDGVWMKYTLNEDRTKEMLTFFNRITSPKKSAESGIDIRQPGKSGNLGCGTKECC